MLVTGSDLPAIDCIVVALFEWTRRTRRTVALWSRNRKAALWVGLGGTTAALAFHVSFRSWTSSPFHLIREGMHLLTEPVGITTVIVLGIAGLLLAPRSSRSEPTIVLAAGVLLPLAVVSLADLGVYRGFRIASWEGANYLSVALPLVVAWGLDEPTRRHPVLSPRAPPRDCC